MTDTLLKPCPFSGEKAEIYSAIERMPDADGTLQGHWVADCTECNANIEFCQSPQEAAKAWNTRAMIDLRSAATAVRGIFDMSLIGPNTGFKPEDVAEAVAKAWGFKTNKGEK